MGFLSEYLPLSLVCSEGHFKVGYIFITNTSYTSMLQKMADMARVSIAIKLEVINGVSNGVLTFDLGLL